MLDEGVAINPLEGVEENENAQFDEKDKLDALQRVIDWERSLGSVVSVVLRKLCREQKIPSHIQNLLTIKLYKHLRTVSPGNLISGRELSEVDEIERLCSSWAQTLHTESKRKEKEKNEKKLIRLFTSLCSRDQGFRDKLRQLERDSSGRLEKEIEKWRDKEHNVRTIHLTEMNFMLSQEESIVNEGGDFKKDLRALGERQADGWERMNQDRRRSLNDLDQVCKSDFENILNFHINTFEDTSDELTNVKEIVVHGKTGPEKAIPYTNKVEDKLALAKNMTIIEKGLLGCLNFKSENKTKARSNDSIGTTFQSVLPTRETITSALSLGKIVAGPWVGLLPDSLSLIGGDNEANIDEISEVACMTKTSSTHMDIYLGAQVKVAYRLIVQVHLNGLYFGLKRNISSALNSDRNSAPLTGVILPTLKPSSDDGYLDPDFLDLVQSNPEFIFDGIDAQSKAIELEKAKQFSNIEEKRNQFASGDTEDDTEENDKVYVSVTKHSNLGLGVQCVLHVERHDEVNENIKRIQQGLRTANSLGLVQVMIPLSNWILSLDEIQAEKENTGTRKPLDPSKVKTLFRVVKSTLMELSYHNVCSLKYIVFVLKSNVPNAHINLCMKSLHENNIQSDNSFQVLSAETRAVKECIIRDKSTTSKAETLLQEVFRDAK